MSWLGKILGGTIGFAMADFRDAPKIITSGTPLK